MPFAPPIYRKAPGYPVYYKVDFAHQMIESIKDWPDKPKSIDHYPFYPEFAENISDVYEPVPKATYLTVRAYVKLHEKNPRKSVDQSIPPQCALSKL